MSFFESKGVSLLDHPPRSPDLNPMENLWGLLVRRVYANGKKFNNCNDLKEALEKCWNEIEPNIIDNLVSSMTNRVFELIMQKGKALSNY